MRNNLSFLNVYEKSSVKSKITTQLLYGDTFKKIKKSGSWIKIKNDSREKNPNELVITKNQKVNPAVTAIALNRGEESSILNRVNEGY